MCSSDLLVCPLTKGALEYHAGRQELWSRQAKLAFPIRDGIPIMLEKRSPPPYRRRAARMSTPFTVIIPARLASSRLPEKALADIAGKPMVVRTHYFGLVLLQQFIGKPEFLCLPL